MARNRALLSLLTAPAVGLAIAVWAEFADLGPPVLLAVAVPAIIVSTLSAGYLLGARPIALVLIGGLVGLLTAVLFGIHVGVGVVVGLGVGAMVALMTALREMLRGRTASLSLAPTGRRD